MRGVTAKRLRKIARSLGLEAKTSYTFIGPLRRYASFTHPKTGKVVEGPPVPRPMVMKDCFRSACKAAKKIYFGKPASRVRAGGAGSERSYADRVVDSMREYKDA